MVKRFVQDQISNFATGGSKVSLTPDDMQNQIFITHCVHLHYLQTVLSARAPGDIVQGYMMLAIDHCAIL